MVLDGPLVAGFDRPLVTFLRVLADYTFSEASYDDWVEWATRLRWPTLFPFSF